MEINFSNGFGNNIGVGRETPETGIGNVKSETAGVAGGSRPASNLTIGEGPAGLASAEPVADVPDAELKRDDALGKLVNSAFCFAAPPMPKFE